MSAQTLPRRRVSAPYQGHPDSKFLSAEQAAIYINCHVNKMRLMLRLGAIKGAWKLGQDWRVPITSLEKISTR